jgi:opacity protein-like surface antigen
MKRRAALIAASLLLAAPVSGMADGLSYNYWEAAWVGADVDSIPNNLDGWGVGGSFELTKEVFLAASYTDVSTKVYGVRVGERDTSISVGYAYSFTSNFDAIGRVGYVNADAKIEHYGGGNDDGYLLGVGVRARPVDQVELEGEVRYIDLGKSGDNTAVGAGVFWYFVPQVAVAISGSYSNDSTTYGIGIRGTWGRSETKGP